VQKYFKRLFQTHDQQLVTYTDTEVFNSSIFTKYYSKQQLLLNLTKNKET